MDRDFPANWREIFAKNIQLERERIGLTQLELAEEVGLASGSAIVTWEKMDGLPRFLGFIKLCELFGRWPNDLLTVDLSGSSPPPPKQFPLSIERDDGGERGGGEASSPAAAESPPAALAAEMKALQKTVYEAVIKMGQLQEAVEHQSSHFDK